MAKPIQYCKVKKINKAEIKKLKKKKRVTQLTLRFSEIQRMSLPKEAFEPKPVIEQGRKFSKER